MGLSALDWIYLGTLGDKIKKRLEVGIQPEPHWIREYEWVLGKLIRKKVR
jgi:hypothetical protein